MTLAAVTAFLPLPAFAQMAVPVAQLTSELKILEVAPQTYVVTHSYPWPANSMFLLVGTNGVVFVDTPYTPEATNLVIDWIIQRFGRRDFTEINTGYHFDNLGGNKAFADRQAPIVGSDATANLISQRGEEARRLFLQLLSDPQNAKYHDRYESLRYVPPNRTFPLKRGLSFSVSGEPIEVLFPGETHAPDNVVVYFPHRKLLFGGCMILSGDSVGNVSDANMATWANAVSRLESLDCQVVVPGHGTRFDPGLIANTLKVLSGL